MKKIDLATSQVHQFGARLMDDHRERPSPGRSGAVLWLTGLSGAGKTTLAIALQAALTRHGYPCFVLDGDNLRQGLCSDLGFSPEHRKENVRRAGEVAALFCDAGLVCISALISPYRDDRAAARDAVGGAFHEIHIATPLAVCEARDPKGLYKKARCGELKDFTGVSAVYEAPERPEMTLDTSGESLDASLERLLAYAVEQLSKSGQCQAANG